MNKIPTESQLSIKPPPHDWHLDTLRPLLKKFQQHQIPPNLDAKPSIEHEPPFMFDEDGHPGKLSQDT
jgi:hypothetical protein